MNRVLMLLATCGLGVVSLSAAPRLALSDVSVGTVLVKGGANGATQTIQAYNAGSGTLSLTASSSTTWLSASVGSLTACGLNAGGCYPVNIALNTATLAPGAYTEYVTLTDPNAVDSPQTIPVTINVGGVPSSLDLFVTPSDGVLPETQFLLYTASNVTGTATTQSGGNWLILSGNSGFVPGNPATLIGVARAGQVTGVYTGSVTISGSTSPAENKTIAVTLTVTNSPIVTPVTTPVLVRGYAGGGKTGASVAFANAGAGTLAITGTTATAPGGSFLSPSVSSANSVSITADPTGLTPGIYHGTVGITSNAANSAQISVPVEFTVEAAGPPLISAGGIVNIANYAQEAVSPGELLAIFGDQLAPVGTFQQNSGPPPLANSLAGVQVLVNGVPAPLYYVLPGQIAFQMPYEAASFPVSTVQVVSGSAPGNTRSVKVAASAPRMMPWQIFGGNFGIGVNSDGSLPLPAGVTVPGFTSRPAKMGDTLVFYCIGFGQTTPGATTGAPASAVSPYQTVPNVSVVFGGGFSSNAVIVPALFAGLTPTLVGLYQVNVTIPQGVLTGSSVPVAVNVGGVLSNFVNIAISQ